ncbi:MAG TPA: TonB-dependent receptor [Candidatus Baltobacteraceae bacterium]|nr:TonB-dependent receptor [Candidatus Baltobacteraceae bacterium]
MDKRKWLRRWAGGTALVMALVTAFAGGVQRADAQTTSARGVVAGTVTTADGAPVAGAAVTLSGPARQTTTTDGKGAFRFASVAPGVYAVTVAKAGFAETRQEDVAVVAGSSTTVNAQLLASSFSSLREIGRVSTNAPGRAVINTGTAAISVITDQTFVDQGQDQVTKILNETPGIVATRATASGGVSGNGADEASPVIPQIRGALPYETETLVDGHPVSVGANGFFSPLYLNPALLQTVEIAKGPGVLGTDINYAIGGSVNYRTLMPTRTLHAEAQLGVDSYGGTDSWLRVTGSVPSHVVDYAFAYAVDGTPGPLQNYSVAGSQVPLLYGGGALNPDGTGPWYVNGRGYAGIPEGLGPSHTPQYSGVPGEASFAEPLYVCCSQINTQFLNRAELAKLRFNFSQQTTLTLSYLGAQSTNDGSGASASSLTPLPTGGSFSTFAPPPGYVGAVPPGTPIPFDLVAYNPSTNSAQQSLVQAELRSALGPVTVLARYYAGTANDFFYNYQQPTTKAFAGATYGGAALCGVGVAFNFATGACADGTAPTMTYFNGQQVTFSSGDAQTTQFTADHLRGYSVEFDAPIAGNVYTLAFDQSRHDSLNDVDAPVNGIVGYQVAPGSEQTFTTLLARGQFTLTSKLSATVSNYAIEYASHYSGDGGATFSDSTRSFDAPRAAFVWRPDADVAWRFSAGSSIAPPYISLISAPAQVPEPNSLPATYFTLNTNNGNLKPETAFGYDLGMDKRIGGATSLSADVYLTNLHNMFLPETFQQGTYANAESNGVAEPLFITQTENLGFARYEGVELAIEHAPIAGFGFKLQGALQRGFPYDLPPGFYSTAAGPYTTNLAILPGVNFQPSGLGYNGIDASGLSGRVPYSTGYAEINYRNRKGLYANIGVTYYGPNNSFNEPAFGVVSAALRVPLSPAVSLQLTADNLTAAYANPYFGYFSGIPVPLVKGASPGFGTTDGGNYGPTTARLALQYHL